VIKQGGKFMPTYIISAHGVSAFDGETAIPANTSVHFYQPFGKEMPMDVGFALQTALTHPNTTASKWILDRYTSKALWNGIPQARTQKPDIHLTPDAEGVFKSGIVRAEPNFAVVQAINTATTLSAALAAIRHDADNFYGQGAPVDVHCLFCL
jgi:hypothetical protein